MSTVIDGPSSRYIKRVAKEIGYINQFFQSEPTHVLLSDMGIECYLFDVLRVPTGGKVTIYSVDADIYYNSSEFDSNHSGSSDLNKVFAVDWAIEDTDQYGNGTYRHLSYVFDTVPDVDDLRKAKLLNKIAREIELDKIDQEVFHKEENRKSHWTKVEPPSTFEGCTFDYRAETVRS